MKSEIDSAISALSFAISEEYGLYIACLSNNEAIEEADAVKMAAETLEKYGVSQKAIWVHQQRKENKPVEPVAFIDRCFKRISTDELPF